jgi:hypothetical protein
MVAWVVEEGFLRGTAGRDLNLETFQQSDRGGGAKQAPAPARGAAHHETFHESRAAEFAA